MARGRCALGCVRFFAQLRVLGWKNVLLAIRNYKGTIGQLLAPVVIILLLLGAFDHKSLIIE